MLSGAALVMLGRSRFGHDGSGFEVGSSSTSSTEERRQGFVPAVKRL